MAASPTKSARQGNHQSVILQSPSLSRANDGKDHSFVAFSRNFTSGVAVLGARRSSARASWCRACRSWGPTSNSFATVSGVPHDVEPLERLGKSGSPATSRSCGRRSRPTSDRRGWLSPAWRRVAGPRRRGKTSAPAIAPHRAAKRILSPADRERADLLAVRRIPAPDDAVGAAGQERAIVGPGSSPTTPAKPGTDQPCGATRAGRPRLDDRDPRPRDAGRRHQRAVARMGGAMAMIGRCRPPRSRRAARRPATGSRSCPSGAAGDDLAVRARPRRR